ncbi:TonB family protein [Sphingomonas sp.]|uniref:energy transducer TonB n=1 Tax=Sphingomonas sp. TaxID=28214 RepID=UPI003751A693
MHIFSGTLALLLIATPLPAQPSSPWPAVREFGGATPLRLGSWAQFTDYPSDALARQEQGNVVVKFDIDAEGRPRNCTLDTSSGYPRLDAIPCRLIEKRARFKPATSADGNPMPTKARYSIAFWTPE